MLDNMYKVHGFIWHILRRDLPCKEYRVDDEHTVMIMLRDRCYDSYVMEQSKDEQYGTPFMYMFGTPVSTMTYDQIVRMIIDNAPFYYDLCKDGYEHV